METMEIGKIALLGALGVGGIYLITRLGKGVSQIGQGLGTAVQGAGSGVGNLINSVGTGLGGAYQSGTNLVSTIFDKTASNVQSGQSLFSAISPDQTATLGGKNVSYNPLETVLFPFASVLSIGSQLFSKNSAQTTPISANVTPPPPTATEQYNIAHLSSFM